VLELLELVGVVLLLPLDVVLEEVVELLLVLVGEVELVVLVDCVDRA
jgi:hypothetical protein